MNIIIDFVVSIFNSLAIILKKIQLPGSLNYLYYILGSLILIAIFRVVKSGSTGLPGVLDNSLSSFKQNKYKKDEADRERKAQVFILLVGNKKQEKDKKYIDYKG